MEESLYLLICDKRVEGYKEEAEWYAFHTFLQKDI